MILRHLFLVQIFYFSFKRSLISVSNSASEGPAGASSGSSGFLLILLMDLIIRKIKNAMMTKSITAWITAPYKMWASPTC